MNATAIVLIVIAGLLCVLGTVWVVLTAVLLRRTRDNALLALRSFEATRQTLGILQKTLSMQVAGTMIGLLQKQGALADGELEVAVDAIAEAFPEERDRFDQLRTRLQQARGPRSAN